MADFAFYGPSEIRGLLDYAGCADVVREAMIHIAESNRPQPLRDIFQISSSKVFAVMPGTLPEAGVLGVKVITVFEEQAHTGHSSHQGLVVMFDQEHGKVTCIADAGELTRIRTAAASVVATKALARTDASTLGVFGCGVQAESHVLAFVRLLPLREVRIWGRSIQQATEFAEKLERLVGIPVRALSDAREVAGADIVCTLTSAKEPILSGKWVRPGAHVNLVGSSHAGAVEVDSDLVVRGRFIVDSRRSALAAAAEFLIAKRDGLVTDDHIVAEIGQVLHGDVRGRLSPEQVTVYKSLGHIVQDLAALAYIHKRASGVDRKDCTTE